MTREEAINKLEYLINSPVGREEIDETCYELLDYLHEQEPRVITLEEYKALAEKPKKERDPVWEEWHGLRSTWTIPNQAYGGYGTSWRCWTSRPDQATREATPWI